MHDQFRPLVDQFGIHVCISGYAKVSHTVRETERTLFLIAGATEYSPGSFAPVVIGLEFKQDFLDYTFERITESGPRVLYSGSFDKQPVD